MHLQNGKFTAIHSGDIFSISITHESDLSLDGGYTFEYVTNTLHFNVNDAKKLANALNYFVEINI